MNRHATAEGTERYCRRFSGRVPLEHFHQGNRWRISSIGLGTYLGETDTETDKRYEESIEWALLNGCNLVDTAINYRFQRSERNTGNALTKLIREGKISRDEVVISTKGGFLTFDGNYPLNPGRYFYQEYIEKGICTREEIAANCHCISPAYLENQIERSLQNLQLECIDIYFIHNPETQLTEISRQEFLRRMLAAFRLLERKVAEGKIQIYGTATWNGYREPRDSPSYLSLEELIGLARNAGGEDHHFRAVQLPYNLGMPEAFVRQNQQLGSTAASLIEAASKQGMIVLASAAIQQGQLAAGLPEFLKKFFSEEQTDAQRSIQFVRSTPGITSALVGMSRLEHVKENLEVSKRSPVSWEKLKQLFE